MSDNQDHIEAAKIPGEECETITVQQTKQDTTNIKEIDDKIYKVMDTCEPGEYALDAEREAELLVGILNEDQKNELAKGKSAKRVIEWIATVASKKRHGSPLIDHKHTPCLNDIGKRRLAIWRASKMNL